MAAPDTPRSTEPELELLVKQALVDGTEASRDAIATWIYEKKKNYFMGRARYVAGSDGPLDCFQEFMSGRPAPDSLPGFTGIWEAFTRTGRTADAFWPYLLTAFRNALVKRFGRDQRDKDHRADFPDDDATEDLTDGTSPEPEVSLNRQGFAAMAREEVANLSPTFREVVTLAMVYDLSDWEIADELGIELVAAKVRKSRALAELRRRIAIRECYLKPANIRELPTLVHRLQSPEGLVHRVRSALRADVQALIDSWDGVTDDASRQAVVDALNSAIDKPTLFSAEDCEATLGRRWPGLKAAVKAKKATHLHVNRIVLDHVLWPHIERSAWLLEEPF